MMNRLYRDGLQAYSQFFRRLAFVVNKRRHWMPKNWRDPVVARIYLHGAVAGQAAIRRLRFGPGDHGN